MKAARPCFQRNAFAKGHFSLITTHDSLLDKSFTINTYRSDTKQTTLTTFGINTYEKQGEGGSYG